jgi:hypothetical protein
MENTQIKMRLFFKFLLVPIKMRKASSRITSIDPLNDSSTNKITKIKRYQKELINAAKTIIKSPSAPNNIIGDNFIFSGFLYLNAQNW